VRISLAWLAELVDLPALDVLCERLTLAGIEIEEVLRTGPELSGVKVGHVLERRQHPNADRLSLCTVDVGTGTPVGVVCGAPNVAAGQKVAVALPGTTLPDGTKLKRSKIRGEVSEGMICSARELGLADEHTGILVLDPKAPVGAELSTVIPAGDTILDVEITPNRGDWASMLGIAREVQALFGGELRLPPTEPTESKAAAADDARVRIDAPDGCARYVARVVRGVKVGPSPAWLRARLEAAGMRAINCVVDVTNLVLLELGQPLHAFDLATLRGHEIRVRRAAAGEKLATLDGETRALVATDLVIADTERAIALAGVMGGAETEVRESTTDVLIESAQFHPVSVRRSAKRLGLRSEASYRFERGVDPAGVARAADRCARLIAELAGGAVSRGRVESLGQALPRAESIALDPEKPSRVLGTPLAAAELPKLLARVGVTARAGADGKLVCAIPSWRNDLERSEDLIEEIARIHGYDKIEPAMPVAALGYVKQPKTWLLAENARTALARAGFVELRLFPGMYDGDADALQLPADHSLRRALRLDNPIQGEGPLLSTTLLPGLLRAAQRNQARQVESLRIFEVGHVFLAHGAGELPEEPLRGAALIGAAQRTELWQRNPPPPAFFVAKGTAQAVLAELGHSPVFRAGSDAPYLHPGASGELWKGDTRLCRLGELHPEVSRAFGLEPGCAVLELELDACLRLAPERPRFREVSPYPAVRRDLAVLQAAEAPVEKTLEVMRRNGGKNLVSVTIFDRYEGAGIPAGKVSVAFRLVFQRLDRTLLDTEVAEAVEKIVAALRASGAEIR
jgi:phenylalanyl-tRNA synthetase beta chain